jgi:hypothetical protein
MRAILEALEAHRAAKAASALEVDQLAEAASELEPKNAELADLEDIPPRCMLALEALARDGVEESRHASIREEGWRAFAEGGLDAIIWPTRRVATATGYMRSSLSLGRYRHEGGRLLGGVTSRSKLFG